MGAKAPVWIEAAATLAGAIQMHTLEARLR